MAEETSNGITLDGTTLDGTRNNGRASQGSYKKREYLCLTICGYRKAGMTEEAYRNHMINVSAPMTKDLMVKYGIRRWTQVSL